MYEKNSVISSSRDKTRAGGKPPALVLIENIPLLELQEYFYAVAFFFIKYIVPVASLG
jgi:hypothetical protein